MNRSRAKQAEFPWKVERVGKREPVYLARNGNVAVPVYKYKDGRFIVIWRPFAGADRKREGFRVKSKATERADEVARAIANSQADVVTLSSADRDAYRLAVQNLAPFGMPLHAAVEEYSRARELLPAGHNLIEAVEFFARSRTELQACPATGAIVHELLEITREHQRSALHISNLKSRLKNFSTKFPDLRQATHAEILTYLRGLKKPDGAPVEMRTRDNHRDAIVTLTRFARDRGYLPDRTTEAERIPRVSTGGEVCTYTPEELKILVTWFAGNAREWLPFVALAGLLGMRSSEILRLHWSAVRWQSRVVAIPRKVAKKVRIARKPPMCDALIALLADWRNEVGPLYSGASEDALDKRLRRTVRAFKKATKMEWKENGLRHSFGSYRLALVQSADQVALEMGNSPKKVLQDYNDPKTPEEARAYFDALLPAANVLPMEPARAAV